MRIASIIVLWAAAMPFAGSAAWAQEHGPGDMKLLNESAAALSSFNSDLSDQMKKYAKKEADASKAAKPPKRGAEELQMLRKSGVALRASRPDLANGLDAYADNAALELTTQPIKKP